MPYICTWCIGGSLSAIRLPRKSREMTPVEVEMKSSVMLFTEPLVSCKHSAVGELVARPIDSPAAQDRSQASGSAASADSPATLAAQSGKQASETFPAAPSSEEPGS